MRLNQIDIEFRMAEHSPQTPKLTPFVLPPRFRSIEVLVARSTDRIRRAVLLPLGLGQTVSGRGVVVRVVILKWVGELR